MTREKPPAAGASKTIQCGNCGRLFGPDDGIRMVRGSTRSVVFMRGLFAGHGSRIRCPACETPIAFEPGLFVVGIEPPALFMSGGDALTADQLRKTAAEIRATSASDGLATDVQPFASQTDLLLALLQRLRACARAMKPLNEANAKGEMKAFMAAHWRSISPEVLVASDAVTFVDRMAKDSPEEARKGLAYFEEHAKGLGHLQALTWRAMCDAYGGQAPPSADRTLEQDLVAYVDEEALFDTAIESLEGTIHHYEAHPEDLEHGLVLYALHAVLARAMKLRDQPNPLAEHWTARWIEVEFHLSSKDAEVRARFQRCELSAEAVADTLRRKTLFNVAVQQFAPLLDGDHPDELQRLGSELERIAKKASYADMPTDVVKLGIVFKPKDVLDASQAMALLNRIEANAEAAGRSQELPTEQMLAMATAALVAASDADGLRQVFEQVAKRAADDEDRATLEAWLGATLLRMNREQKFLDVVGPDERAWEAGLSDGTRGRLWTERANALRAAGRKKETLSWRRRVLQIYETHPESTNFRTATRLLSIAERETGAPDRARDLILPMLDDVGALDRATMLETASATWVALGQRQKACAALEEAIQLATGPDAHRKSHYQAALASLRHESEDALTERSLLDTPRSSWSSPATLIQECAAWLNLQWGGHELSDEGRARSTEAIAALGAALDAGDVPAAWREQAFMIMAKLAERGDFEDVHDLWGAAADAADALGLVPLPEVVLGLAASNYRAGRRGDARAVLRALPTALARDVERLDRIDVALGTMTGLAAQLDELASELFESGLLGDARAVAEFRRDRLRRAVSRRNLEEDATAFLLGQLYPPIVGGGRAVVLEFVPLSDGWVPTLTWQPAGEAKTLFQAIDGLDADLVDLRDRIVNRLQGWVRGRPGDPFEMAGWKAFCAWLQRAIDQALPEPSHLVVIEAEGLEGIPFHVAVAPEWTCSYASSWMSLHAAITAEKAPPRQMGFAMIPAYADDASVAAAMHAAGQSLQALAGRVGLGYDESVGADCDKAALAALLAASDVAFVAGHGYLHEEGNDVAWVLAHQGGLPGKSGALVQEGESAVNHLSWRDIERLERTPRVVWSAACSSGRTMAAGLGERIGMYQSLSNRGTQSLVAPAWDVEADLVMPIAVHALELHIERQMSLAQAVREACAAASRVLPAWCAWPLTIEGAWE